MMQRWARRVLMTLLTLAAILFVTMGLRWLVNPLGIAPDLGLALQSGLGLSSQIGDFSAFFMVLGLTLLAGLVTRQSTWFYPPAMLLLIAAAGRLVAWAAHDAAFAAQMIAFEVIVALLALAGARLAAEQT
jgi:hypothetical protein